MQRQLLNFHDCSLFQKEVGRDWSDDNDNNIQLQQQMHQQRQLPRFNVLPIKSYK